jgi:hypothetical protein
VLLLLLLLHLKAQSSGMLRSAAGQPFSRRLLEYALPPLLRFKQLPQHVLVGQRAADLEDAGLLGQLVLRQVPPAQWKMAADINVTWPDVCAGCTLLYCWSA